MVNQNPLVLDEAQRNVLESGGGTAETTRTVRATVGKILKIIVMLVRWGGAKSQKLILAGGAMQLVCLGVLSCY